MRAEFLTDPVIKDGVWIDARAYGDSLSDTTITAAISDIGSDYKTLVLSPGAWTISDDLTIPANVTLKPMQGAVMTIASGKIMRFRGGLDAGLYQIFGTTGEVSGGERVEKIYPQWWGAVPGDSTVGEANYTAIRKALAFAISPTPADYISGQTTERLAGHTCIHFSAGVWFIKGNSPLGYTRTEMEALDGGHRYRRGLKYSGDGNNATILVLENNGSHTWFYSNYDSAYPDNMSGMSNMVFENLSFRGTPQWTAERYYPVTDANKISGFYFESSGFEQCVTFNDCEFMALDTALHYAGAANADKNTFFGCQFKHIVDYVLYLDNDQSIQNRFIGCDFENIYGDCFHIGEGGGGDLKVSGGSVIMQPEYEYDAGDPTGVGSMVAIGSATSRAFLHIDVEDVNTATTPSIGFGNNLITIEDLRFEVYDEYQKILIVTRDSGTIGCNANVCFRRCSFFNEYSARNSNKTLDTFKEAFVASNNIGADILIESCQLNRAYQYVLRDYDSIYGGQFMRFVNCYCVWDRRDTTTPGYDDVTYAAKTPGDTVAGDLRSRCIIDGSNLAGFSAVGTTSRAVNATVNKYRLAFDFDYGMDAHFRTINSVVKYASLKSTGVAFPMGVDAVLPRLYLPEGAMVIGMLLYKPAVSDPGTGGTLQYFLDDKAGNHIWSGTSQFEYEEIMESVRFDTPYVMLEDDYICVSASYAVTYTAGLQPTDGYWVIEYI